MRKKRTAATPARQDPFDGLREPAADGQNHRLAVFGQSGSGKSYKVAQLIAERRGRVLVWDHQAEYSPDFASATYRPGNAMRGVQGYRRILDVQRDLEAGTFPVKAALALPESRFRDFCRLCIRLSPCLAVVEEAWIHCENNRFPRHLANLVRDGRHYGVDQVYVAQRPQDVATKLRSQMTSLVFFRTAEPADLKFIAARCSEDVAKGLPNLPLYGYRAWRS